MRGLAARKRGKDSLHQRPRGVGAKLHRHPVAAAFALIGEVDGKHVIERRVIGMVEIDIGGIDPHPAPAALRATDQRSLFDDIRAHGILQAMNSPDDSCAFYSAATLAAEVARLRLRKSKTFRQPSSACSGR